MPRPLPFLLICLTAACLLEPGVAPALGAAEGQEGAANPVSDQGSSFHYRSLITGVTPAAPGLSVQVLQFADRLQLINHTHSTVTIYGYQGEPYARVLADGTTEQNTRSPATYLNKSFYGDINVPPQANPRAAPSWQVIDRTGQLEWHDHRIHYTSPAVPPQVKDRGMRTLIFNWSVPIAVGARHGAIAGQLFWVPESCKGAAGSDPAGERDRDRRPGDRAGRAPPPLGFAAAERQTPRGGRVGGAALRGMVSRW